MDGRLMDIEMAIAVLQKSFDELNQVVVEQGATIDQLQRQNRYLHELINGESVKPLSEETRPPHY